jgi:carboxymethylenebutenolidase
MVLENAVDFAKKIPSANGKVVVIGFCWGGSQSFRFASQSSEIEAAIVCYGTGPKKAEDYKNIHVPVYGFYGGNDNRVNATLAMSEKAMKLNNQLFEAVIYEGAGHGFFRAGEAEQATKANRKAREEGIERLKAILAEL